MEPRTPSSGEQPSPLSKIVPGGRGYPPLHEGYVRPNVILATPAKEQPCVTDFCPMA